VSAGGRTFRNAEPAASRRMTLTRAFAESCNTAFVRLAAELPDTALAEAARLYGFGLGQPLPVSSVGGAAPAPTSDAEAAAAAIGQGRVTSSPLHMASVAAAVASGTWRQPRVLPCDSCEERAVPVAAQLRPMMRAVVRYGTGTKASAPGGPVHGKTGTAEHGQGSPPPTHAWFVGWQGTTAFAVFVEEGSSGGRVAAPVAARFLRLLG
jgi:cell division protein FtsI/penicillin-binding protein 2